MNAVFLDTAGLLAVWDTRDQWHAQADRVFRGLLASRARLLTSTFVLLECGNAAARRPYRQAVVHLGVALERSNALIVPTDEDWRTGWSGYERVGAHSAGLVDHISFAIMRRLNMTTAFTHDKHFRITRFQALV
ncbi:MAG TPA: PIN domain-containing protein [Tepidisphaeraceae bacterium]|jgi:hypothetical protein